MSEALYKIPLPLRPLAISVESWRRGRRKFGAEFRRQYEFLTWSSPEEREQHAAEALEHYLRRLKSESRFYEVPDSLDPGGMPIYEKSQIVANQERIELDPPFFTAKSSGTSGLAIRMPYTKDAYQKEYAFWWYHAKQFGVRRGDRVAMIAGHRVVEIERDTPPFWLFSPYENQLFLSSYHLSRKTLPSYVERLNKFRPDLIHGYPSSVYLLAREILESGRSLSFQPRMIRTASETLLDFQRDAIARAFGRSPAVWYGNTEFAGHAEECLEGRLHLQPWHSLVRIVKDDGQDARPGEEGRIVATNFTNTALPLVNYDTKDVARVSLDQRCGCGMGGMILDSIVGRVEDYIVTRDGRFVGRLDHLFKATKHVRCAQLEQDEPGRMTVRIEKDAGFDSSEEDTIAAEARNRLGPDFELDFSYVDEIARLPNGKVKFVVQKIRDAKLGVR